MTYISLAVISVVFLTDIFIKNIVLKAGRHKLKRIQKQNLDKLLNSSICAVKKSSFFELRKSFMSNNLTGIVLLERISPLTLDPTLTIISLIMTTQIINYE